ncbi:MAG TPA: hypothetical protein VGD66_15955 [Allosphingosinicella sp.]
MTKQVILGGIIALVAILIGAAVNLFLGYSHGWGGEARVFVWLATLAMTLVFVAVIGNAINGRWHGIIVDARNRVSLSKFQATAWTILVSSALATYAAARAATPTAHGIPLDALGFTIPPELLVAMGISAASLVAAPAVLSLKTDGGAAPIAPAGTGIDKADGLVAARSDPECASWLDMFRGDEVGNAAAPDLSKVQQFLVSVVLITVYATLIAGRLVAGGATALATLPPLDEKMVWLLGISHATYITYKAVPHSGSSPGDDPAGASVG